MNTQLAFAFGVLAVIAIIMLVAIVVGIVKVIRHDKQFRNLHEEIGHIHRHFTEVERGLYLEIDQVKKNFDRYTEEVRKETQAYTDSRVDKLEQKLTGTSKQIIKD